MSIFGKNIKKIRSVRGLTQSQLAEMLQVNRGMISSYEEGRAEPKIETILKTAEVFQLSTDMLLKSNVTVNQLTHFSIPEVGKFKISNRDVVQENERIFRFLPQETREIHSSELPANPYLKKNDIALVIPAKPVIGKIMILVTARGYEIGKISFMDAKNISIDPAGKSLLQATDKFEVLGIYSPVQNLSPIEEKLMSLEARLLKLEAWAEGRED
jgi:transcriptional regulator with XRE-family HTH domain